MVKPHHEASAIDLESESLLAPDDDGPDSVGPPSVSGAGLRARHKSSPGSSAGVVGSLLPEAPPLSATVDAFVQDEQRRNPITEGDFPLRALAQGLSMLSLDELRRLHLPQLPWQTGEDGQPSMLESLRRKPWKAHYTSLVGFIISTGSLIAHLWCAVVACLLIVFVSQSCPPDGRTPVQHECRLSETQNNLNFLGRLVVTCNWISFISFLGSEVVFFRREAYLISHFNDDDAAPYNQLPTFITDDEHAHVLDTLRKHNKLARTTALGLLSLCSFNLVISCCLLLTPPHRGGRYNGLRTLVSLVSNTLLLARRVVQNARISNLSFREDLALSLYQMKFRSFNDLLGRKTKAEAREEAQAMNGGVGGGGGLMSPLGPLSPALVLAANMRASASGEHLSQLAGGATPLAGRGHTRSMSSDSLSGWEALGAMPPAGSAGPHGGVSGAAAAGAAPRGLQGARNGDAAGAHGDMGARPSASSAPLLGDGGMRRGEGPAPTRGSLLVSHAQGPGVLPPPPPSPPESTGAASLL